MTLDNRLVGTMADVIMETFIPEDVIVRKCCLSDLSRSDLDMLAILHLLHKYNELTRKQIQHITRTTDKLFKKMMSDLEDFGYVVSSGSKNNKRYKLSEFVSFTKDSDCESIAINKDEGEDVMKENTTADEIKEILDMLCDKVGDIMESHSERILAKRYNSEEVEKLLAEKEEAINSSLQSAAEMDKMNRDMTDLLKKVSDIDNARLAGIELSESLEKINKTNTIVIKELKDKLANKDQEIDQLKKELSELKRVDELNSVKTVKSALSSYFIKKAA